jgi:CDP-diacylglycerol---glycerol-3-phosphate 3-phosphatidyltransferase
VTIYDLKPAFQNLLRPVTRFAAARGITANQVTLAACVMSVGVGLWIGWDVTATSRFLALPGLLFVRMALNAIDGMLAREHGQKSRLGAILNELTDVISDSALYLPFALLSGNGAAWLVGVVLLAVLTEMTGVLGPVVGSVRRYDGPMGKSDRAFVFGVLALLVGLGVSVQPYLVYVWMVLFVLLARTVWNRASRALKEGA